MATLHHILNDFKHVFEVVTFLIRGVKIIYEIVTQGDYFMGWIFSTTPVKLLCTIMF